VLEETFAAPELNVHQRLAARFTWAVESKGRRSICPALTGSIGRGTGAWLTADAWDAIVEATDGCPDSLISCAIGPCGADALQRPRVDRQLVQTAWADLQQLPTRGNACAFIAHDAEEVVEFGA